MDSRITSKGQITIPKAVRDHLGVKPGGRVKFFVLPNGGAYLLPVLPITALKGIVPRRGRPVSIREMREAPAAGAADRYARSIRKR